MQRDQHKLQVARQVLMTLSAVLTVSPISNLYHILTVSSVSAHCLVSGVWCLQGSDALYFAVQQHQETTGVKGQGEIDKI